VSSKRLIVTRLLDHPCWTWVTKMGDIWHFAFPLTKRETQRQGRSVIYCTNRMVVLDI